MIAKSLRDIFISFYEIDDLNKLSNNELKIGITSGCFDLLHPLHILFLEKCKSMCDYLIVGVDSDLLMLKNKNKSPMFPEIDRLYMIESLKFVDCVVLLNNYQDLGRYAERYPNAMLFKNSDNIYDKKVDTFGLNLVIVPDIIRPNSTTEILAALR